MRITKKSILTFIFLVALLLPVSIGGFQVNQALADTSLVEGQVGLSEAGSVFGGSRAEGDPRLYIVNIINIVLGFLAIVFVGLLIGAGFMYMTAGGNQEKTSKAMGLIRNAVIGIIIVIAAWSIARFTLVMINRAAKDADTSVYPTVGM